MKFPFNPALKSLLGLALLLGLGVAAQAQPIKGLQNATKTVTAPMKDVQKTTKEVVQPIKDTRKAVNEVTKAPKAVEREINATEKSINSAGNEVKKAKTDIDKTVDKLDGDKAKRDSTKAADSLKGNGKTVIIDERTNRDKVVNGSGYGSSGGTASAGTGQGAPAEDDYRRVLLPPAKGKTNIKGGSGAANTPVATPKPDYSASPARDALESADFAVETLNDLFTYAEWDGPTKDHTMRSVDYMLKQLRHDIDEIRVKDPDRSVWSYEKKYRDWRNTYVQHGGI
jgi:TolA-binding protein